MSSGRIGGYPRRYLCVSSPVGGTCISLMSGLYFKLCHIYCKLLLIVGQSFGAVLSELLTASLNKQQRNPARKLPDSNAPRPLHSSLTNYLTSRPLCRMQFSHLTGMRLSVFKPVDVVRAPLMGDRPFTLSLPAEDITGAMGAKRCLNPRSQFKGTLADGAWTHLAQDCAVVGPCVYSNKTATRSVGRPVGMSDEL